MPNNASVSDNKLHTFSINQSLRPAYYDDFKCLAQDCKFTCCAGWRITMNRKDYLKMRKQAGSDELLQEVRQSVHKIKNSQEENLYAEIRCKENGFCPMVTEKGLCRLQLECGHNALPDVCKTFPRSINAVFSGYMEQSLSTACEAVLELLWNQREGIEFIAEELPSEEQKIAQIDASSLYTYFQGVRSLCIGLLQDRRFPVNQRIFLMGIFLQRFPFEVDAVPQWLAETEALIASSEISEMASGLITTTDNISIKFLLQNITTLKNISSDNHELTEYQREILKQFVHNEDHSEKDSSSFYVDYKLYKESKENFSKAFGDIEYFFENLAVSIFFHFALPNLSSAEKLWKNYVSFCNVYSLFRFMAITSCSEILPNQKEKLFTAILAISRSILHNSTRQNLLRDSFFENESSSLAHMAVLLSQ